ncbi:uncharacterized protein LOC6541658 [Drosophila erecta]|uniref:Uncharacterized protein n=1 Tax=Drosophila erecta TaxID=7220 RepID=B3N3C8_DROER|nr:uncharacterized protein LOC6541658 [Drosophila erecta]EDV58768.1 uncharacterized protein Dere_GG10241 [Drosophila erecta]
MAWVPRTRFEHDLVQLEPGFNLIHGQIAYELMKKQEFAGVVPINTYEYLAAREDLLGYGTPGGKGREIRQSLQMMEKIQRVAGTKPLGEHATMEDWEDTTTVEKEALAIIRNFGRMSIRQDSVPLHPEISLPNVVQNGSQRFHLITDRKFFAPRKIRRPKELPPAEYIPNNSTEDSFHTAESLSSCIWLYGSKYLEKNSKESTPESTDTLLNYIKSFPVEVDKNKTRRRKQRPSKNP